MKPNSLIKTDDLHWCEDEGDFVPLSQEEMDSIIYSCIEAGHPELDDIMKCIRWAEQIRIGHLLLSGWTSGRLKFVGFAEDEPDEPCFVEDDA